jgi:Uma2 family endonuclease
LTTASDDAIVVVMERRITTGDYFSRDESNRPAELVYGVLREPPTPGYGHQTAVGRLFRLLSAHVEERGLGDVCISPMDVVLDREAGLIVQPDVLFISKDRAAIIRNHVWGAPDLVIEVASPGTGYRDRTVKLAWYRKYGVRECWLVDTTTRRIDIVDCEGGGIESFGGKDQISSRVLPNLSVSVSECFT